MSTIKAKYATPAQRRYIDRLAQQVGDDTAMEAMIQAHQGGYDLADMGTVKRAAGYLSRSEASQVIDTLKAL